MSGSGGPNSRKQLIDAVIAEFRRMMLRGDRLAVDGLRQEEMSMRQAGVLLTLTAEGPTAMGELARRIDVSVASATGLISRMERRGWVRRERSREDLRVVMVVATNEGANLIARFRAERGQAVREIFADIPEEDLQALLKGLRSFGAARERYRARHGEPDED